MAPSTLQRALARAWAPALLAGLSLAGCRGEPAAPALAGYVEAEPTFIASSAAGTLLALPVQRGDAVAAGDLLFRLDPDAEAHTLEAATARQAQAEAQLLDLQKGRRPLELQALDQQLAQAEASLAASRAALTRQRELVQQGYLSALQLDALLAAAQRDEARVAELQAQRAFAREGGRTDALAAARAAAGAARADVALARWKAAEKVRVAPVAAVVQDVLYRLGEWVPAGAPVVQLLPPGAVRLRFYVPEPMLAQLSAGRELAVHCDGCANELTARVRWVSPQAEFTPPVLYGAGPRAKLVFRAEADGPALAALKPGQPVDVRLRP